METPLVAQLVGADIRVTGLPDLAGWSATVHADGAVTLTPAPGERVTWPRWRAVPIGAILSAANELTGSDRLDVVLDSLGPVPLSARTPGPERDRLVASAYRRVLAAGFSPRSAVATYFEIPAETAKQWIAHARETGALLELAKERARLAGRIA